MNNNPTTNATWFSEAMDDLIADYNSELITMEEFSHYQSELTDRYYGQCNKGNKE